MPDKPLVTVPDTAPPVELQRDDEILGDGTEANAGKTVVVHYVVVSWSTDTGFVLEATSTLSPAGWSPVLASATVVGARNNLTVPVAGTRYYRLRQP